MFLTMFLKTRKNVQTMHLTMLIAHPYHHPVKIIVQEKGGPIVTSFANYILIIIIIHMILIIIITKTNIIFNLVDHIVEDRGDSQDGDLREAHTKDTIKSED